MSGNGLFFLPSSPFHYHIRKLLDFSNHNNHHLQTLLLNEFLFLSLCLSISFSLCICLCFSHSHSLCLSLILSLSLSFSLSLILSLSFSLSFSRTLSLSHTFRELAAHDGYLSCCRFIDENSIITSSGKIVGTHTVYLIISHYIILYHMISYDMIQYDMMSYDMI